MVFVFAQMGRICLKQLGDANDTFSESRSVQRMLGYIIDGQKNRFYCQALVEFYLSDRTIQYNGLVIEGDKLFKYSPRRIGIPHNDFRTKNTVRAPET